MIFKYIHYYLFKFPFDKQDWFILCKFLFELPLSLEAVYKLSKSVIPAKAGIYKYLKLIDSVSSTE